MRANLRGLPIDSVYMAITRVVSSSSQNCSRSLPDTSDLSPSDTNHDSPMSSSSASRSTDPPSVPDCSDIATLPGGRLTGSSDAWRPIDGRDAATPALPGPIRRTPARRARTTSASTSMSVPSTLVSTTAPRTCEAMQSSMTASR